MYCCDEWVWAHISRLLRYDAEYALNNITTSINSILSVLCDETGHALKERLFGHQACSQRLIFTSRISVPQADRSYASFTSSVLKYRDE